MSRRRDRVSSLLERAASRRAFVRIDRFIPGTGVLAGFLVGLGERWVLVHREAEGAFLDGWSAVRRRDVAQVRVVEPDAFPVRALRALGEEPTAPDAVHLDATRLFLQSVAGGDALVTLYVERDDPSVCYVGRLDQHETKRVVMRGIDADALWIPEPLRFRPRDITRVDVGTRYDHALLVAAQEPEARKPS